MGKPRVGRDRHRFSRLNGIGWHGNEELDAQPGALWGAVATTALERSLIPPVMPDAMMLSVGGTLSAGGRDRQAAVPGRRSIASSSSTW
jgi:hypothetical protein